MCLSFSHVESVTELLAPLGATKISFIAWVDQASAGDRLEYFRGALAFDLDMTCSRLRKEDRVALEKLARCAIWAAEHEYVHLIQQRYGSNDYGYLAVARPKRKCAPSLSSLLTREEA
jgi:hypothetical protein